MDNPQVILPNRPLTKEEFFQWFFLMRASATDGNTRFYSGDVSGDAELSWKEIQSKISKP